jgi:hypothetical protein
MKLELGVVCFIDILGFGNMVEEDADRDATNLGRLLAALDEVGSLVKSSKCSLRTFSDSIILSAPLVPSTARELLELTAKLQAALVAQDILVRGGIALGRHFANESVIYSQALVRAYLLESKQARVPRILVERNFLDWLLNHGDFDVTDRNAMKSLLLRDNDMHVFVGYLSKKNVKAHAGVVRGRMAKPIANVSVLEKTLWLVRYHNFVAKKFGVNEHVTVPQDGFAELPADVEYKFL